MNKTSTILAAFILTAAVSFADTWTGRLVDASCKAASPGKDPAEASCSATAATHLFAIELPGAKILNLDAIGNTKASTALKGIQKTDLKATVTGSLDGQMVKVDSIEIQ